MATSFFFVHTADPRGVRDTVPTPVVKLPLGAYAVAAHAAVTIQMSRSMQNGLAFGSGARNRWIGARKAASGFQLWPQRVTKRVDRIRSRCGL
jgi:hypothetical protein